MRYSCLLTITLLASLLGLTSCANTPIAPAVADPTSMLVGNWEGKWAIDSTGFEGKAQLVIETVIGGTVTGHTTMFNTPFGDLTQAFSPAAFDGAKLNVKHGNNVSYVLSFSEKEHRPHMAGPLVYVGKSGTYHGTIRVVRQ
ncbi:hypothetical protein [Chitinimonas sp. BJB300]|uniref:hypothetical protein n=1 Tax=Chitinimonas sp. BJB300 TaxID=1559339 RepID=UPI000C0F3960|nr:hypothetical protein [Chitinimonas sp. BJB300]PHV13433.1 hypothetical protein CSQ89_00685 [Chitinimonas sp. BJB300]TSJ89751.1 hypothetical protein FG002_005900 [Chitinimonas sp. BJB300]